MRVCHRIVYDRLGHIGGSLALLSVPEADFSRELDIIQIQLSAGLRALCDHIDDARRVDAYNTCTLATMLNKYGNFGHDEIMGAFYTRR
jgi:hypothetical protein